MERNILKKATVYFAKESQWNTAGLIGKRPSWCPLKKVDTPKLESFGETITPRSFAMKKSNFTEEQIAFAHYQADTGTSVDEVCRKVGLY